MSKDFHNKPFDEGTKVKLLLYEKYLQEWLPVFLAIKDPIFPNINIFDFFAGSGEDKLKVKGSPLLAVNLLSPYFENIINKSLNVTLYFNEIKEYKLNNLKNIISSLNLNPQPFKIHFSSLDFQEAFNNYFPLMNQLHTANFLFLDQSGIKAIEPPIFKKIISLRTTDFLFFISSSYIHRFAEVEAIKKYISIPKNTLSSSEYLHTHRTVFEFYKSLLPQSSKYFLAPFSIRKGANIYGLIFGSHSVLGIEKFLKACWNIDSQSGEANFDIDQDNITSNQPTLFEELGKSTKLHFFEQDLEKAILGKKLKTNKDIYIFALENGCLSKHAKEVIKNLIDRNVLPKQELNICYRAFSQATSQLIRLN